MFREAEHASRHGDMNAVVAQDKFTYWLGGYPRSSRNTSDTVSALNRMVGKNDTVKLFYTDSSGELIAAARALQLRHDTCTPNRPQTNGVAEAAVQRVKEGTRAVLLASGLGHHWWAEAM